MTTEELGPGLPADSPVTQRHFGGGAFSNFLISLSGASPDILRRCPTERAKYTGIGSAVLASAVIASIPLAFALHLDVSIPVAWSVFLSLLLGITLIALDRWLIASLDRQTNPWRYLILAVPRLVIGVILGITITTPLLLQAFNSYIDNQVATDQAAQRSRYYSQLPSSVLDLEVERDQAAVNDLEHVIAAGGIVAIDPSKDPQIESLTTERNQAAQVENDYYKQWQCQLYGGPTCPEGSGPLANASRQSYETAQSQVASLDSQILKREQVVSAESIQASRQAVAQAQQELPGAKVKLQLAIQQENLTTQSYLTSVNSNNGLIPRLQALSQISEETSIVTAIRWLLYTFFVLIQCLPIGVKVLLNLGPENTYEKMLKLEEEGLLRAAREDVSRRQTLRNLDLRH